LISNVRAIVQGHEYIGYGDANHVWLRARHRGSGRGGGKTYCQLVIAG
jgi:hypothetical protein